MVYVLALGAALLFAVGSVVQQRSASEAPPNFSLSLRLLLWLVRKPLWLVGVGTAIVGNVLSGSALALGSVALVQPLLVTRLLFALPLAAALVRQRIPNRDLLGAAAAAIGLGTFVVAGHPQQLAQASPSALTWGLAIGSLGALTIVLVVIAKSLRPARQAPVLGVGAGLLFGLQAGLMQTAVHHFTDGGVSGVLLTWSTYAVIVTAVAATLLAQSAYEMAPLTSSYPALAAVEPLAGIGIGVGVLSGSLRMSAGYLAAEVVGLAVMTVGTVLLANSSLVTGQEDVMERKQKEGAALRSEDELRTAMTHLARDLKRAGAGEPGAHGRLQKRVRRELSEVDRDIDRLRSAQREELRLAHARHRHGDDPNHPTSAPEHESELDEREHEIERQAVDLRARARDLHHQAAEMEPRPGRGSGPRDG